MSDTLEPERKSKDVTRLEKLSRMLRSMSRRFPKSYLLGTEGDFGVRLDAGPYLHIVTSGNWSDEDLSDFLALFAAWLRVDPNRLRNRGELLGGVSITALDRGT